MSTTFHICEECNQAKSITDFDQLIPGKRLFSFCKECSDKLYIKKYEVTCSAGCNRKLPETYYQHYRTRFTKEGFRLRVNTNCVDCSKREGKILSEIKKANPPPPYLTPCPQCNKIVYEKSEDIPEGVIGTNGPWQCDHDHKDGTFRGYLCTRCNTGTGLIGDNSEYFENAKKFKKRK